MVGQGGVGEHHLVRAQPGQGVVEVLQAPDHGDAVEGPAARWQVLVEEPDHPVAELGHVGEVAGDALAGRPAPTTRVVCTPAPRRASQSRQSTQSRRAAPAVSVQPIHRYASSRRE